MREQIAIPRTRHLPSPPFTTRIFEPWDRNVSIAPSRLDMCQPCLGDSGQANIPVGGHFISLSADS